ncbi:hypothetical protein [Erwinia tasmaniensis]|uniref:Uncharacterized protein n=1 Tax=Erwinia tasmaniensis (strain DSM 17950 / CFBP 7177 / CIP 109463 / NCPPB 4357 / Et1/99) TaxID=465817 RepID=B2VJU4_ERWT9|nr:hypothetical protein [Erwinia tasmaniensis]CAO98289.1 hypothetical protein ETA_32430 [Erwinia tasmaniensis Et1/99]
MDIRPTDSKDILPDNQESHTSDRACSQLKRRLGNIEYSNEPLPKATKEKKSSSLNVVEQPDITALLENKQKLEESLVILQKKLEINTNVTGEYIKNDAERDAQLAYLNEYTLNQMKDIEKQLAETNKQLSELKKEDASSRSGS